MAGVFAGLPDIALDVVTNPIPEQPAINHVSFIDSHWYFHNLKTELEDHGLRLPNDWIVRCDFRCRFTRAGRYSDRDMTEQDLDISSTATPVLVPITQAHLAEPHKNSNVAGIYANTYFYQYTPANGDPISYRVLRSISSVTDQMNWVIADSNDKNFRRYIRECARNMFKEVEPRKMTQDA
jgi:hypothetical protein